MIQDVTTVENNYETVTKAETGGWFVHFSVSFGPWKFILYGPDKFKKPNLK